MLLVAFTKNWWKSLTKNEEGEEVGKELSAESESEFAANLDDENVQAEGLEMSDVDGEEMDNEEVEDLEDEESEEEEESFTHQGAEREFETEEELAAPYPLDEESESYEDEEEEEEKNYSRRSRSRNKVYTAKDFFNTEIHYRFDNLDDEERKNLSGTYRLELKGYQGGVWSVKVSENVEVVNRREDTEIVINMQHRDFISLANGQLNPQLAIFAQKMKIVGDLKKAINFQLLVSPESR